MEMRYRRFRFIAAAAIASSASCAWLIGRSATLPIPCVAGACGVTGFVGSGQATAVQTGSRLTVNQTTPNVLLNWQSFNISADGSVQFVQPSATAVALNQIFQSDPSKIFGALTANGRVFLLNQNGIIFGSSAQVNVGSLLASTLKLDPAAMASGLLQPGLQGLPAAAQYRDANGNPLPAGSVWVQQGARIQTSEGGQVLLFAPQVTNEGTISTPGGQTVLAAGTEVYLAASTDPNLRGLWVEVGNAAAPSSTPTVTNGNSFDASVASGAQLVGQIIAERGNVTLAGLAVNQLGRVSATTSINQNGSIRLQARQGAVDSNGQPVPAAGSALVLGPHSDTEVTLETSDPATTVDGVAQPKSRIDMFGSSIEILDGSVTRATSGVIDAVAQRAQSSVPTSQEDGSRIYVAPNAQLDVSGASVVLPVSSNVIPVQLRGTELADSALQRNGPLRGQTVYADIRAHGTRADGTEWQGTPLADVSGEIAAIAHNVAERNLTGGTISLQSQGDVILSPGALLNLAGGQIQYTPGVLNTTTLLTAAGKSVDISAADPNLQYAGILNSLQITDQKWGVTKTYAGIVPGVYSQGYVEGKDAGTLELTAPRFVLDANVNAATVAGLYQRLPTQQLPATNPTLYRSYDQVPAGAQLSIGSTSPADFVTGNLTIQAGTVLPGLRNADGSSFDPLDVTAALPAAYSSSVLRPELIGPSEFGALTAYADGKIVQPANSSLRFPAGGSLSLRASSIDLEGSIDAPGGLISVISQPTVTTTDVANVSVTLGSTAALTARGEWVNDNPLLYPSGNVAPLYVSGGKVSLTSSQGNLTLEPGSLIDVSGGAQFTAGGKLNAGHGGTIQLGATTPADGAGSGAAPSLQLDATLLGYGISQGGTLSLTSSAVCIAASACAASDAGTLSLSPATFAAGGFSNYQVTAQRTGLNVAPGTSITLQQQNLQLPADFSQLRNAPTLIGLASVATLADIVRQPVNLSLTQSVPATSVGPTGAILTVTPETPSLTVGEGAVIRGDPGAALTLASNSRLIVDGTLSAPGGTISLGLALNGSIQEDSYEPSQAIWLGPTAVLDVHGVPQILTADTGLRSGKVQPGGTVNIAASLGSVELLPGSVIDVSGSSGIIDIAPLVGGRTHAEEIASAAGAVNILAAQNISLSGTIHAQAAVSGSDQPQPQGGSLTVVLQSGSQVAGSSESTPFPEGARQIVVSQSLAPVVVKPGTAVPDSVAGIAQISADSINAAGFDSVTVRATPLISQSGTPALGEIDFSGNVSLHVGRQLTLDAAKYGVSPTAVAQISAPYVEFGNSDARNYVSDATSGTGTLEVSGQFIELYGSTSLEGIGKASFSSTGDLRLRGIVGLPDQNVVATMASGNLKAAGSIDLTAQQIYPSTLTSFSISSDPNNGTISVHGTPGTQQDLLSAGGSLTLNAATVNQDGVLRAPFGTITLNGKSVELGAGSLTSTSANGLTIPFGVTQGGFDWVYQVPAGATNVYGTDGVAPPAQHVVLQGASVDVKSGAVVDVSGGGDLQAYEWVKGVGGTKDVLSQLERPGQFAIIPTLQASVAPYDPNFSANANLQPGDSVYLSGAPGLPAGTYLLLPARYALLPGAFVVSAAPSTYQDILPGQSFPALGGGTIVSGYRTVAGTALGDSRASGFTVIAASTVLQQAQYEITSANQFFSAQASAAQVPASRLPRDSGVLALLASASLSLDGSLRAKPGDGGLGAGVDISSAKILVAANADTPAQTGQIVITAASLDALGAQSLLLGGERANGAISTQSQSVTVDSGAVLNAPEILLTANDQITVANGASLIATGAAAQTRDYTLQGDGAFLSVSAGPQATVTRTGQTGNAGVLALSAGSSITANQGSVYLEAADNVLTEGSISATGGDLALQSTHIIVGAPPQDVSGTVLTPGLLTGGGLKNIRLVSNTTVDLYGSISLSAQNLTIDARGISGFGAAGDSAAVSVTGDLTLTNTRPGDAAITAGSGSGSLSLSAADIGIGPGTLAVTGFPSLSLNAQNAVTGKASETSSAGTLSTDGNLTIVTPRLTTAAGVSTTITATGAVSLMSPAQVPTLAAVADLGGSLAITGNSIELGTQIILPSGRVSLVTTGSQSNANLSSQSADLVLDSGARIDVAGLVRQYDTVNVPTPGGTVTLTSAGNMNLAAGSVIDVSGGANGVGGSLAITASTGTVNAAGSLLGGGSGDQGSSFAVDALSFGDFGSLNHALNVGGFAGSRAFRTRGPGDLVVATGTDNIVRAHSVSLEADQGSINLQGLVDASGTKGGSVLLAAANDVIVSGTIDAHASGAGQNGGRVELDTTTGRMLLNAGSIIDVSGGSADANAAAGTGGTVLLRVPQQQVSVDAVLNGRSGVALNGSIQGSRRTTLEAYLQYDRTTISAGDVAADPSNPLYGDALAYMTTVNAKSADFAAGLGKGAADPNFVLEPGVEVDSAGDLTVNTTWDFASWRFTGLFGASVPGVLTLRAAGNVTVAASISDGFADASTFTLPATPTSSWSYRIVAGADQAAANPLTVDSTTAQSVEITGGSTTVTRGGYVPHMVRTGDGFIDVSASGDFKLDNRGSMLYTAGVADPTGITLPGRSGTLQGRAYPVDGGDIRIAADGNIVGAPTNQFVNAWLWRAGPNPGNPSSPIAWTVDFQNFQQGVGALGGGNVTVSAGGDITNFSASIPSIGMQVGSGTSFADSVVDVVGGGNLNVTAGGSILGGSYYVGLGTANLRAGKDVGAVADATASDALAPLVGLGDSSISITARGNAELAGIFNPTLLPTGASEGASQTFYSTYSADSAVSLVAVGGDVNLKDNTEAIQRTIGSSFSDPTLGGQAAGLNLDVLPPTLAIAALSADINLSSRLVLSPASNGNLQLFADQNVHAGASGASLAQLIVSDADPALLPSIAAPQNNILTYVDIAQAVGKSLPDQHAAVPVHSLDDPNNPVRIVARTGDVILPPTEGSAVSGFWSAKPVHVVAGRDIVNLDLVAQNLSPADVTSVVAGRDIVYPLSRDVVGNILPNNGELSVDGPGQLQISAGRNINLGTSTGITTRGNLINPSLPTTGASVSVEAGVGANGAQFAAFIAKYIDGSDTFDQDLVAFVEATKGESGLTSSDAKEIFDGMSPSVQRTFVEEIFFDVIRTSGRYAATSTGHGDFSDAFAAIKSLFPGANPDLEHGEKNPYAGNIELYFSRIYTLSGGGISLLAPGGEINVGLAAAPDSFGVKKEPAQLGLVAQSVGNVNAFQYSDFQVNQSRVFAADGGNILDWSTEGNIDAGRGAKTSISAPPPTVTIDPQTGAPIVKFPPALTGSGIQTLATSAGVKPGDVDLFAPHGVVNANDAGIVAGNLTIAATAVLGTSNITVSGTSVGVPVAVTGLGANVVGASSAAGGAMNSAASTLTGNHDESKTPAADNALGWLDVFVLGFGEETCKAEDAECLKRQSSKQ